MGPTLAVVADRRRPGVRLFSGPRDEPRARRATDVFLLVGSVAGLTLVSVAVQPPPRLAQATSAFLAAWPTFLDGVWQVLGDFLLAGALGLVAAAAYRRRAELVRDLAVAAAVAFAGWLVVTRSTSEAWPSLTDAFRRLGPPAEYPSARAAMCVAVLLTASPHLATPTRRIVRWIVGLGALSIAMIGAYRDTRNNKPFWQRRRHILHTMYSKVNFFIIKGLLDLFDE